MKFLAIKKAESVGLLIAIISVLTLGACFATPRAYAAEKQSDMPTLLATLMAQIQILKDQLNSLQPTLASESTIIQGRIEGHRYMPNDDGKDGKPKIVIKKFKKNTFSRSNPNDPVTIGWQAFNVPANSVIEVELHTIKLTGGGGVGGGTWMEKIVAGDSAGWYDWRIAGVGRAGAGTYQARVIVYACEEAWCGGTPDPNKTSKKLKQYARSAWRPLTITGEASLPLPVETYTPSYPTPSVTKGLASITSVKADSLYTVKVTGTINNVGSCEFNGSTFKVIFEGSSVAETVKSTSCEKQKFSVTHRYKPGNHRVGVSLYALQGTYWTYFGQDEFNVTIGKSGSVKAEWVDMSKETKG